MRPGVGPVVVEFVKLGLDRAECDALLAILLKDHQPSRMTEHHHVDELAAIIWQTRRVLIAECAAINRGLHSVVYSQYYSPVGSEVPFDSGLKRELTVLLDLLPADERA